jgi:hypothetical protein
MRYIERELNCNYLSPDSRAERSDAGARHARGQAEGMNVCAGRVNKAAGSASRSGAQHG